MSDRLSKFNLAMDNQNDLEKFIVYNFNEDNNLNLHILNLQQKRIKKKIAEKLLVWGWQTSFKSL